VAALSLDVVLGTAQFNLTTCERARLALAIGLAGVEPLLVVDGTIDAIGAAWRPAVRLLFAARAETGGAILAAGRDTDALAAVVARIFTLHAGRLVPDAAAGAALPAASVVRVAEPVPARGSPLH
jgi:ABC-type thiamine transport system ATPase subunit